MAKYVPQEFWDSIVIPDLSKIRGTASTLQPSQRSIADSILAKSVGRSFPVTKSGDGGLSFKGIIGNTIDFIERPLYALTASRIEAIKKIKESGGVGDVLGAIGLATGMPASVSAAREATEALQGKEKPTGGELLAEAGVDNTWAQAIGGLTYDLAADPLNLVPGAWVAKGAQAGIKGAKVAKDIAKATPELIKAATKAEPKVAEKIAKELAPVAAPSKETPAILDLPKFPTFTPENYSSTIKWNPERKRNVLSTEGEKIARHLVNTKKMKPINAARKVVQSGEDKFHSDFNKDVNNWRAAFIKAHPDVSATDLEKIVGRLRKNPDADISEFIPTRPQPTNPVEAADRVIEQVGKRPADVIMDGVKTGDTPSLAAVENAATPNTKASTLVPLSENDAKVVGDAVSKAAGRVNEADRQLASKEYGQFTGRGQGNQFLNPSKQRVLYNNIRNSLKIKDVGAREAHALTLFRHAIKEMQKQVSEHTGRNMKATDFDGNNFDLADVLDRVDTKAHGGISKTLDHINNAFSRKESVRATVPQDILEAVASVRNPGKVAKALEEAPVVQKYASEANKVVEAAARTGASEPALATVASKAGKAAGTATKSATGSDDAARTAEELVSKKPSKKNLEDGYKENGTTPAQARDEDIKFRDSRKTEFGISSWIANAFNPWYGTKAVRSPYLEAMGYRMGQANIVARSLRSANKQWTAEELRDGFNAAQRGITSDAGPETFFTKFMEDTFGSSGFTDEINRGHTVFGRTNIGLAEFNDFLRTRGVPEEQLFKDKIKLPTGETLDLTAKNPYGWVDSWKYMNVDDPLEWMSRVRSAVELNLIERSTFSDVAAKFGSRTQSARYSTKVAQISPHLEDVYFEPEIAQQLSKLIPQMRESMHSGSKFLQHYDKIMSMWKTGVTVLNPRHHINSLVGDTFLNWLAGVWDPRVYSKATKVINYRRGTYKDLANMPLLGENPAGTIKGSSNLTKMKNGHEVSIDEFLNVMNRGGVLPGSHVSEDIIERATGRTTKTVTRKVAPVTKVREFSEARDHWPRMAHAINILERSKGTPDEVYRKMLREVRKWHPDGIDLTKTERTVFRRLIPFYSWTRKAIPLVIEAGVHNPNKTLLTLPKIIHALQTGQGFPVESFGNPFPEDQLFPDWIKSSGIGPIFGPGADIPGVGNTAGYTVINPKLPGFDFVDQYAKKSVLVDNLTPFLKIPLQISGDFNPYGAPPSENMRQYLGNQVPILGPTVLDSTDAQAGRLRWLLGNLAPRDTGTESIQNTAEYDERQRQRE